MYRKMGGAIVNAPIAFVNVHFETWRSVLWSHLEFPIGLETGRMSGWHRLHLTTLKPFSFKLRRNQT